MKNYAGFDVSFKEVSICVVDENGKMVARGVSPADPDGIAGWLKNRPLAPERIVHESGQRSAWRLAPELWRHRGAAASPRAMPGNG